MRVVVSGAHCLRQGCGLDSGLLGSGKQASDAPGSILGEGSGSPVCLWESACRCPGSTGGQGSDTIGCSWTEGSGIPGSLLWLDSGDPGSAARQG